MGYMSHFGDPGVPHQMQDVRLLNLMDTGRNPVRNGVRNPVRRLDGVKYRIKMDRTGYP